jgi:hypothetical protein
MLCVTPGLTAVGLQFSLDVGRLAPNGGTMNRSQSESATTWSRPSTSSTPSVHLSHHMLSWWAMAGEGDG